MAMQQQQCLQEEASPDFSSSPPPINNIIKRRRRLTAVEAKILQQVFEACPRPSAAIRDKLADRLGMSRRCIQIWFQNRRAKQRRDLQEAKQPALSFKPTLSTANIESNVDQLDDLMLNDVQLNDLLDSFNPSSSSTSLSSPDLSTKDPFLDSIYDSLPSSDYFNDHMEMFLI